MVELVECPDDEWFKLNMVVASEKRHLDDVSARDIAYWTVCDGPHIMIQNLQVLSIIS